VGEILGTDWTAVTAWATIALTIVTGGLVIFACAALGQIGEAKRSRNAQIMGDLARRWDSDDLINARKDAQSHADGAALQAAVEALFQTQRYYKLLREPNFYEDLAYFERHSGLTLSVVAEAFGDVLVGRWKEWKPAVEWLRGKPYFGQVYEGFETLANRVRAYEEAGGQPSSIWGPLWKWLREPILTIRFK
jgi:hypothetical protein